MLRKFKIATRIQLLFALLLLSLGGLLFEYWQASNMLMDTSSVEVNKRMAIQEKEKITAATTILSSALAASLQNVSDPAEQEKIIQNAFTRIRFEKDKSGYFYAYRGTTCVAHGANTSLINKDLSQLKGPDGTYIIQELFKLAKAGGGITEFDWNKPGEGLQPKIGSAQFIDGTDIWIGTGIYMSNILKNQIAFKKNLMSLARPRIIFVATLFGIFLIGIMFLCAFIIRSILRPLSTVTKGAKDIAAGQLDLHIPTDGTDELSELAVAMNLMSKELVTGHNDLHRATLDARDKAQAAALAQNEAEKSRQDLQTSYDEILRTAHTLEQAAVESKSMMDTLTGHMSTVGEKSYDQINQMSEVDHAMDNLHQAAILIKELANQAMSQGKTELETVREGSQMIEKSLSSIKAVHKKANMLQEQMSQLDRQAESINQVMVVISDIADQTNLLALNAAIEAARAGEAGRGFAVVADEVRKLAEKTMEATKKVDHTISGIQQATQVNAQSMDGIAQDITETATLAEDSGERFKRIADGAETTYDRSLQISEAADRQANEYAQVSSALVKMEKIVAASGEEVEGATQVITNLEETTNRITTVTEELRLHANTAS
ncbi:methyl-accepting chemotaxis protein [Halodesulfovibrio aestuarii]|uniref:Methyl-accepting chemotaxis sensory transducer with Cache sensor n=1 Tax=Halodesulfovibrio aestuarii TaxID=126333 RepID=A0A8G2C9N0_9BACT|nr:methyl-accepting chemotaxis protein [Halodesulfovibrio aestuarii]SHI99825.1 methyl-accepting chemotaxis sensory transducer with Cache sensor [Halodesulfovibrio aestuarii]